jgi:hypothetical protein
MRLDREVGTLNRDIIAIKEKWKIALNIDSKKVAIEKLITMRKRLRDSGEMTRRVQEATEEEQVKLQATTQEIVDFDSKLDSLDQVVEKPVSQTNKPRVKEETPIADSRAETHKPKSSSDEDENKPAHLTVSWLKNRIKKV